MKEELETRTIWTVGVKEWPENHSTHHNSVYLKPSAEIKSFSSENSMGCF